VRGEGGLIRRGAKGEESSSCYEYWMAHQEQAHQRHEGTMQGGILVKRFVIVHSFGSVGEWVMMAQISVILMLQEERIWAEASDQGRHIAVLGLSQQEN